MKDFATKSTGYSSQEYVTHFDPALYLREYYSMHRLEDADTAIAIEANRWLSRRFLTAIDVGCGPVLIYPFIFAPFVDKYDLADYLPANLNNIQRWIGNYPESHNWAPLFGGVLKAQGLRPETLLLKRSSILRNSINKLRHIDLFCNNPLGQELR